MARMTEQAEERPTPASKLPKRTGRCNAYKCKKRCDAYEFREKVGAYNVCQCGHTQQVHTLVEVS